MEKHTIEKYGGNKMEEQLEMCPLRMVMDMIGGKWKLPILCVLATRGTTRYGQIRKQIPAITNMMLAQSLKELEQHGLVTRVQYNEVPPRVEYSLTPYGETLLPALKSLGDWGKRYISAQPKLLSHCESCTAKQG